MSVEERRLKRAVARSTRNNEANRKRRATKRVTRCLRELRQHPSLPVGKALAVSGNEEETG